MDELSVCGESGGRRGPSEEDVSRANEVAETIAVEYGLPLTREGYVERLAYAYARGSVDGYRDATRHGVEALRGLRGDVGGAG